MVSYRKMPKKASSDKIDYISQPCLYGLGCIQNTVVEERSFEIRGNIV